MKKPLEERFWSKVRKADGCWEWTGAKIPQGYGQLSVDGKLCRVHRLSYILANGFIPAGLLVLHRCDNRGCVRPSHLFLGTQTDNMRDAVRKDRWEPKVRGSRNGNVKLKEDDIVKMRAMRGISYVELGRRFGITESTARWIMSGQGWEHVAHE